MQTFFINPITDDLEFDSRGNLVVIEGEGEERQSLRLLLSTNLGEWFLDEFEHGLDYSVIQVKNHDINVIENEVRIALTQESRVQEIISVQVEFKRNQRLLTIIFKVRMESGNIIADEVVI